MDLGDGRNALIVAGGNGYGSSTSSPATVAMFDGTNWTALPGTRPTESPVLAVFRGELYLGGSYLLAAGPSAIVKWDGANWVVPGTGLPNYVASMVVYHDELYLTGGYSTLGGARMARWNGSTFSGVAVPFTPYQLLAVHEDKLVTLAASGNGQALLTWDGSNIAYVPGSNIGSAISAMTSWQGKVVVGANSTVKAFDGVQWSNVGVLPQSAIIRSVTVDAAGRLYAGGTFGSVGLEQMGNTAVLDEAGVWRGMKHWDPREHWFTTATNGPVYAIAPFNGAVAVVGLFSVVANMPSQGVAVWGTCAPDFNCDHTLDFFDYLDFVQALSTFSTRADFNGDGAVDFADYLDFVDAFSAGC